MIVVSIIVAVICSTFVYVAFKHTYTHEKRDLKITKRMLSNKIAKKIKNKKK